jgi:uncharacterized membrane protein YccC
MRRGKNYLREIQKFTTSQYWNSGVRITSGVMVPMLIMANQGWLSMGMPFLWGALFVSLTDTPGPIQHRRNGMLAGIALNTLTVLITGVLRNYQTFLLIEVVVFCFFFSLLAIYGTRAGAVGTLALVVMLLNMSPLRQHQNFLTDALLTAGGGLWYFIFSISLYRLQPYRLVEQALGENVLQIADYIRARAAFYKVGADIDASFNRVMQEQVIVLKNQNQMRELIFKTRQFVSDPSPKSRSIMMVFLESMDLFEETMYVYQDYKLLHQHTRHTDLLPKFHRVILRLASTLEHVGLMIQTGVKVNRKPDFTEDLRDLTRTVQEHRQNISGTSVNQSLDALEQIIENIRSIGNRISKLVMYTEMKMDVNPTLPDHEAEYLSKTHKPSRSTPWRVSLLIENLTLRSNNFRYALRITAAMLIGYGVSAFFAVSHTYWVLLTIITILKPVYNVTRKRNIQRLAGTLSGVLAASAILFVTTNSTVLLALLVISMVMAYSFLRINYLGFVIFLTIYIIITFHFLNPVEFKNLIGERLIDTFIGSVIAALAARFIFPVWEHENIKTGMQRMLEANRTYFLAAWNNLRHFAKIENEYNEARNEAIVALTNLSDNFQQMLAEPGQAKQSSHIHQFVIASHTLTSRISALGHEDTNNATETDLQVWADKVAQTLRDSEANLLADGVAKNPPSIQPSRETLPAVNSLSIIHSLAHDIRNITRKIASNSD